MFTGIIEEMGEVENIVSIGGGIRLRVRSPRSSAELQVNDSVAIDGVCQTVIFKSDAAFEVIAVEETLKKTTLGFLHPGAAVNLELPMRLNERLGGHLVLGHVDTVGEITALETRESSWMFTIAIPQDFMKYVIPVGSIAVDGVSLTVAQLREDGIGISIIPHTMEHTTFQFRKIGDKVNLEFDVLGKYVERLLASKEGEGRLSEKLLRELGY